MASHCARRTSTFRSCAFREHRRPTKPSRLSPPSLPPQGNGRGCPILRASNDIMLPSSSLVFPSGKGTHVGLRAAVERGPSEGARYGSKEDHRIYPPLILPPGSHASHRRVACLASHCAHRTSTFPSCGFCEQEGHLATPHSSLFVIPHFALTGGLPVWPPTARVQRAPSERARCASTGGQQATLPFFL